MRRRDKIYFTLFYCTIAAWYNDLKDLTFALVWAKYELRILWCPSGIRGVVAMEWLEGPPSLFQGKFHKEVWSELRNTLVLLCPECLSSIKVMCPGHLKRQKDLGRLRSDLRDKICLLSQFLMNDIRLITWHYTIEQALSHGTFLLGNERQCYVCHGNWWMQVGIVLQDCTAPQGCT